MAALNLDTHTVSRRLRALQANVGPLFGAAMREEIDEIETPECIARTPVKTGRLASTVHTVGPEYRGKSIYVGTEAGGPEAPYGIEVHERTEVYHANGQAKFIESVYRESGPFILQRVARRVDIAQAMRRI